MTAEIKLEAQKRGETNTGARQSSRDGFVLANLYGAGAENKSLKIKKIDFDRAFAEAGESNLISLSVDGKDSAKVIIKEIQKDPVKDNVIHVDLYEVDMKKEITTEIPFNFVGESKAVKELGGNLSRNMSKVEVKCLPSALVNSIDVDISGLDNFHDAVRLEDLKLPEGINLSSTTNNVVVSITEPKKEEEKPEEAEAEEGAEETKEGDKKEGEEGEKKEEGDKKEEKK